MKIADNSKLFTNSYFSESWMSGYQ